MSTDSLNKNTYDVNMRHSRTRSMTLVGMMAAVICIAAPISVPLPFSPVPLSMAFLAIYFTAYVLGMKAGTVSCCIYLLLGLAGLPVFAGFSSGPGKLLGPTGGYLIGYLFLSLISGYFVERWERNWLIRFLGMILGTAVCYLFGTLWLAYQADLQFGAALALGVLPFIPGDLGKIVVASLIGPQLRVRLKRAGLI